MDALLDLRFRGVADAQAEGDVLEDGHVTEEGVMLKDETDVAITDARVGDVLVLVEHGAAVGDLETGDDAQERRLAGARRAEEGEQRAARDLDAQMVECDEVAEALGHVFDTDAHACPPSEASRAAAARSLRVFHSSALFTSNVTTASDASTEATANAPGMLYS